MDAQQNHPEGHRELQNHARGEGTSADIEDKIIMTQDTSTYYVWIGGSCDYGHKERAGGAAVVIEHNLVADLRYICLFLFIDILLLIKLCLLMEGPRCPQHQVEYMRASLLSQSKREAKE